MTSGLRAIVFDLDGTLVDSLDDITAAVGLAFAEHHLAAPTVDAVRGWVGRGARALIAHALSAAIAAAPDDGTGPGPHGVPGALVELVLERFRAHYGAAATVHTRLYPGVAAQLDRLAAAGRSLAVLSNKPHGLTLKVAGALLEAWPFAVIVGERPGVPTKPDPEAGLAVARELGVAPTACALVGDSPVDVACARGAGMVAVAVSWGYRPRAELEAAGPAFIADTPADLDRL